MLPVGEDAVEEVPAAAAAVVAGAFWFWPPDCVCFTESACLTGAAFPFEATLLSGFFSSAGAPTAYKISDYTKENKIKFIFCFAKNKLNLPIK